MIFLLAAALVILLALASGVFLHHPRKTENTQHFSNAATAR
jgi:uncharacterized iron-regulated membrane protein